MNETEQVIDGLDEVEIANTSIDEIDSENINLIFVGIDKSGSMGMYERDMEENTSADFKPATQKPSGGNMSAFIFGGSKGSGRFMGNKRKHTVRGMKRR